MKACCDITTMNKWPKRIVHWTEGEVAFLSVVFTWHLPQAYSLCCWYGQQGYRVRVGGVAVKQMPEYLSQVAEIGGDIDVLWRHNSLATFTSRGCVRKCAFCAVPIIEGSLVELSDFVPKPIVCDNNILACSRGHFEAVVDCLKPLRGVDFNQGLDARLLKSYHLERLKELDLAVLRFAWDDVGMESQVMSAIDATVRAGFPRPKIRCYILFNFKDTPEDALYRCNTLKQMGILPNVQRYQPLKTLKKNKHIGNYWDRSLLADFHRYWAKQIWFSPFTFEEYRQDTRIKKVSCQQSVLELV